MVGLSGLSLLNEVSGERLARVRGSVKTISKRFSEESLELTSYISARLLKRKQSTFKYKSLMIIRLDPISRLPWLPYISYKTLIFGEIGY